MTTKGIRARRPRISRARTVAAMSVIVLQAHVGMSFSARAGDLEGRQVVDVSRINCEEFLRMPLARAFVLVGWIGGFHAGRKNDTKVEVLAFVDEAERVISLQRERFDAPDNLGRQGSAPRASARRRTSFHRAA